MDFTKTLLSTLLFVFFSCLFPNMNTAIEGVSISEPLYPLLRGIPYLLIGILILILASSMISDFGER